LKASANHNKVQCECMFWDCFPFQKQYLFHPFPGRSDPSTSAHSQGQYQERPAACSLTTEKRCGRLVSEVVAQSKPNQPGRYPQLYLTRLWALMIWSSTNIAWFYCCGGNISTKSSGQAFWMVPSICR
jgi:hypothetical protein